MAETFATGGRVAFAPLGSSDWVTVPALDFCLSSFIPKATAEDEREFLDLRALTAGASISFDFTMKRRDIRRMIRMLHIRRSHTAMRRSALHSEYHRRQKRRKR